MSLSLLLQKNVVSQTKDEARAKVLLLYHAWMREAPRVVSQYLLDIPTSKIRAKIRQQFELNRHVKDLKVIDVLFFKGRHEFEETHKMFKQKTHVMRYFNEENDPYRRQPSQDFLSQFYDGNV